MSVEAFCRAFRYARGKPFSVIRDVSRDLEPQGACGTFAWSVLHIETGGKPWKAILTGRTMIWRCWSDKSGQVPRHAALWVRGKGWIDSTDRLWRDSPKPHKRAWPVGAPVLAVLALLWASPLRAETVQCAAINDALDALESKYAEHPRVSGLTSAGVLMIITAAEGGGFSVLLVSPDGQACMVASGANFALTDAPKPGEMN